MINNADYRLMAKGEGRGWSVTLLEAQDPRFRHPYVVRVVSPHDSDPAPLQFTYSRDLLVEAKAFFHAVMQDLVNAQINTVNMTLEPVHVTLDRDSFAPKIEILRRVEEPAGNG